MLLDCPECGHRVSDRATACPSCGFPVAEHVEAERRATEAERERESREQVGETDCVRCEARGFYTFEYVDAEGRTRDAFEWCRICSHTGRVALCRSTAGYYAVARDQVKAFVTAKQCPGEPTIVFVGNEPPGPHRYPQAGKPFEDD